MKTVLTLSIAAFAFSLIGDVNFLGSFNNWELLDV